MPVSSPSYFGPQRSDGTIIGVTSGPSISDRSFLGGQNAGANSTSNDMIILGDHAGVAGITNGQGTIAIGSGAAGAYVGQGSTSGSQDSMVVIGQNAASAMQFGGRNVIIGDSAVNDYVGNANNQLSNSVLIGAQVMNSINPATPQTFGQCVVIGFNAGSHKRHQNNCIIGSNAASGGTVPNGLILQSVIIGTNAGPNVGVDHDAFTNTLIGFGCGGNFTAGNSNTCVGANISIGDSSALHSSNDCTFVGSGIGTPSGNNGSRNTAIGSSIDPNVGHNNIFFGYRCNAGAHATYTDKMLVEIEINGSAARRALIFGDFDTSNVLLGHSTEGTDRNISVGNNVLKLLNGIIGDANTRAGGGYFYVSAGALHWVGSAGTDTVLAAA